MKSTKRLLIAALAFVCLLGTARFCSAQTGYTTVFGSRMEDATGTLIANATIKFTPVNNAGVPISFHAGGQGGQAVASPVSALITQGAFTIQLADTTLTSPLNVCYSVTVISNVSGQPLPFPGYGCIQPSGSEWDLDGYVPSTAALALESVGSTFSSLTGIASAAQLPAATTSLQGAVVLPSGASTNTLGPASILPGYITVNGTPWYLGDSYTLSGGSGADLPLTGGTLAGPVTSSSTFAFAGSAPNTATSEGVVSFYPPYGAELIGYGPNSTTYGGVSLFGLTSTGATQQYMECPPSANAQTCTFDVPITVTGGAQGITTPSVTLTNVSSGTTGNLFSYNFDSTGVTGLTAVGSPALTSSNSFTSPDSVNFPSGSNYYKSTLSANSTAVYTRQYINILTEGTTTNGFLQLWDSGSEEFSLYLNANNTLGWSNGVAGTSGSVSATPLSVGSYNYIELYWIGNATTGSFIVRVNGTVVYTSASQNTGSAGVNAVYFGNISSSSAGWNINMDNVDVGNTGWLGTASATTTTAMLLSSTSPGIASGFGTGPTVLTENGPAAFDLQVGTSPSTSGVLTLPTASHQWNCFCTDTTNPTSTFSCRQSSPFSTTGATIVGVNTSTGAAANFTANDTVVLSCFAY